MTRVERYHEKLTVQSPTLTIPLDHHPESLWKILENEQYILGTLGDSEWCVIYNSGPYVGDEGGHIMLSPRYPNTITQLRDIPRQEMDIASRAMTDFLQKNPGSRVVVYNNSDDPRETGKPNPQSWQYFHAHLVDFNNILQWQEKPEGFITPEEKTREPLYPYIENILATAFLTQNVLPEQLQTNVLPMPDPSIFYARGGITFRLPRTVSSRALSTYLFSLDTAYTQLHQSIFSLFTTNYDEVRQSNWTISYAQKPLSDITTDIAASVFHHETKQMLEHYAALLAAYQYHDYNYHKQRRYHSPTYSVGLYADCEDFFLRFAPHYIKRRGGIEELGITLSREYGAEGTSHTLRKENARRLANEIEGFVPAVYR